MADRDARGVRRTVVRAANGRGMRTESRASVPATRITAEPPTTSQPPELRPELKAAPARPKEQTPAGAPETPDRPVESGEPGATGPQDRTDRTDGTDSTDEQQGEGAEPATPLGRLRVRELPDDFVTEARLADHDAEAARLRALAEEARQLLDAPLPPIAPVPRGDRRKLTLGALVAGGAAGVIAAGVLVPWSDLGGSNHLDGAADAGKNAATQAAAPALAGSRPKASPAAFLPPQGVMPASGPGVTEPGTAMTVRVLANGDLSVVEQAVLGPRGMRAIPLTVPSLAAIGGGVGQMQPKVTALRASVNDQGTAVQFQGTGWVIQPTGQRARTVRLSYMLSGTTIRTPSDSGKAISVLVPLLAQPLRAQGLPMTVRTYATKVSSMTCPGAPMSQGLCGMPYSGGWSATMPVSAVTPALLMSVIL